MALKKNILISSVTLVLMASLAFLLSINKWDINLNTINDKNQLQKNKTSRHTSVLEIDERLQDSVLYHKVVMDYGNYWQAINPILKNKKVAFNRYSGKIFIYTNNNNNYKKDDVPADYVFSWDFDTIQPYKINGSFSFTDKDTVMYWLFNEKKDVLTDEQGNIFKRIK